MCSLFIAFVPSAPVLSTPANESLATDIYVTFSWQAGTNAEKYSLQISEGSNFSNIVYSNSNIYDTERTVQSFEEGKRYYWRVKSIAGSNSSAWSVTWAFDF